MTESQADRPKIGLAFSGGSGRAIAHIGVLEVLKEYGIPIDVITACSSGVFVAASYACQTLEDLKRDWLSWDKAFILNFLEFSSSDRGLFSADKMTEWFKKYFNGHRFLEEVKPRLGFVSVDINTGAPLTLCLGDMAKAGRASCAVPGLFEPVEWGNKLLVDGGLVSLVPVQQARDLGSDIVIGVDIAATKHIYQKTYIQAWQGYRFVKRNPLFRWLSFFTSRLFDKIYKGSMKVILYNQSDFVKDDFELIKNKADFFSIVGKALDIATEQHYKAKAPFCDIMLSPNVKHLGKMDFGNARKIYLEGRRVALEAIPEIEKIIKNYRPSQKNA